ncbi:Lrp/AsnC family transcriptional regulator [Vibrio sp. AK197]
MDKFDQHILEILKHNARRSVSDIAREVNLSRSAVTARIKRLETEGEILGYHANLAKDKKEPDLICAYLALKLDTSNSIKRCESYAQYIYGLDGVKSCRAISGETDMMLYVEVPSMARMSELHDALYQIPELKHLTTHTVLSEFFDLYNR